MAMDRYFILVVGKIDGPSFGVPGAKEVFDEFSQDASTC
jgi:hypothetical protein